MKYIFALLMSLCVFVPTAAAQSKSVETVSWLAGCWLAPQGTGEVEENWTIPKGQTMIGISRSVRGDRTTGYEYTRLHMRADDLIYSASPSGQNPADFKATSITDTLLRVEKPDHDFPQKIEYVRATADSLVANVFGNVDDVEPSFSLHYSRVSCD